jgi:hypothetical protein
MNSATPNEATAADEGSDLLSRRLFLQSTGKWSGAAIAAAVIGGRWLAFPPEANAGASAARGTSHIPLDVILSEPASEFSDLYRLVDVCAVRDVRVSMPTLPGFSKAVKLAASLRLPVRILPGQPTAEILAELKEALEFYLHEPMVEAPVEFFHSLLVSACGTNSGSLWMILEEDPAAFLYYDDYGNRRLPRSSRHPLTRHPLAHLCRVTSRVC